MSWVKPQDLACQPKVTNIDYKQMGRLTRQPKRDCVSVQAEKPGKVHFRKS